MEIVQAHRLRGWSATLLALFAGCRGPAVPPEAPVEVVDGIQRALEDGRLATARSRIEALPGRQRGDARVAELERRVAAREIEPFEPALREAATALEAGDDELAERILVYASARGPSGAAADAVEMLKNVLAGRSLLRTLQVVLETSAAGSGERVRLSVRAVNRGDVALALRCSGGVLDFLCLGLSPSGVEQRSAQRLMVDALDRLDLEPGESARVPLGEFVTAGRGFIAVRGSWRLTAGPGAVVVNGFNLPANELSVAPVEFVRLDPRLPEAALEPAELVDYVRRGAPSMPSLLERAVRIAPERREEALDLLGPALLERPLMEIARAAPVLRWLSGERIEDAMGDDGRRWREWLEARVARGEEPTRPTLELPRASNGDRPLAADANVERR